MKTFLPYFWQYFSLALIVSYVLEVALLAVQLLYERKWRAIQKKFWLKILILAIGLLWSWSVYIDRTGHPLSPSEVKQVDEAEEYKILHSW